MTVTADDLEDIWLLKNFDEEFGQMFRQIADKVFCAWMSAHTPAQRFPSVPRKRIIEAASLGKGRWLVTLAGDVGLYVSPTQEAYFSRVPQPMIPDRPEPEAAELENMEDIRRLLRHTSRRNLDVFYASLNPARADLQESLVQ